MRHQPNQDVSSSTLRTVQLHLGQCPCLGGTLPRSRQKKGTRRIHHEGIWTKRAFGFSGDEKADDHDLVGADDYRYLRCVLRGTIPSVRFTLIHSENGPAREGSLQSPARTPTGRGRDKGPASLFPLLNCHASVHRPQKSGRVLI